MGKKKRRHGYHGPPPTPIYRKKKGTSGWIKALIGMLFIGVLGVVVWQFSLWESSPQQAYPIIEDGDSITIPLSEVSENAKWYEYDSSKGKIRFFAVKADDGTIKTAFDACDVCYAAKKGYKQEGKYMVCNNCGRRFAVSGLGTENKNPGGCWPGYLPNTIDVGNVVIKKSDLENKQWGTG